MKKLILTLALIVPALSFTGCSSDNKTTQEEPTLPKSEVSISLDYTFVESGNMSRSGASAYQEFFDNYIKTKQLAPKKYSLTFDTEEGKQAQSVTGPWAGKSLKLREGTYKVKGYSYPTFEDNHPYHKSASDSLFLNFDETVNISKTTTKLTLSAQYDCFLLLFPAENIDRIIASYHNQPQKVGNVYCYFVNAASYNYGASSSSLDLSVFRKDGTIVDVQIGGMGFEKGKYYYFDDLTNSFNIEPMPNGNQ